MKQLTDKEINEIYVRRAETIAHNISELRKKKGLSQTELSFFINTAPTVVIYAERGTNRDNKPYIPTVLTIEKIAIVLGVSLYELITMKKI